MGCNCSKNKAQPTGFARPSTATQDATRAAAGIQTPQPQASGTDTSTKGATESFTLQDRNGRTQSFGSKLEANAARVRAGGGTIRPA